MENYIKKILLVSDNDAYNRLYEFVGREEINEKLKKYELNRYTNHLQAGYWRQRRKHKTYQSYQFL